jgi:ABC-type antimicrobial peptide transport system permease subunit
LSKEGHTLSVRFSGSAAQAQQAVRALWPRYYQNLFLTMHSASEILADNYAEDVRMARLLAIATGIALAIAAFGTYVLSAHTVQRRAREIVLRKLHGAGRGDIGVLVLREVGTLALAAAAIGLPIAGVVIARYLAGYVERAPIGYWTLLGALAASFATATLAAARHAWSAMQMQPAAALRT